MSSVNLVCKKEWLQLEKYVSILISAGVVVLYILIDLFLPFFMSRSNASSGSSPPFSGHWLCTTLHPASTTGSDWWGECVRMSRIVWQSVWGSVWAHMPLVLPPCWCAYHNPEKPQARIRAPAQGAQHKPRADWTTLLHPPPQNKWVTPAHTFA